MSIAIYRTPVVHSKIKVILLHVLLRVVTIQTLARMLLVPVVSMQLNTISDVQHMGVNQNKLESLMIGKEIHVSKMKHEFSSITSVKVFFLQFV